MELTTTAPPGINWDVEYQDVSEFGDIARLGREFNHKMDVMKWKLGDLVVRWCANQPGMPVAGRPPATYRGPTRADLAREWGCTDKHISYWGVTAAFYPYGVDEHGENFRRVGTFSTFSHHDLARRKANGDLVCALAFIDAAIKHQQGITGFRKWLSPHADTGDLWMDAAGNTTPQLTPQIARTGVFAIREAMRKLALITDEDRRDLDALLRYLEYVAQQEG